MKKKRRKKKRMKIFLLLIILLAIILILLKYFKKGNIELKEESKEKIIEINTETYLYDLINEEIESDNYLINTTKLGTQNIKYKVKGKEKILKIKVVDTTRPVIDSPEEITTTINEEIEILNKITVTDNSKESPKLEIAGEYDLSKVGNYELEYIATDASNNIERKKVILKVLDYPKAPANSQEYANLADGKYKTEKGYILEIKNKISYIDGNVIVNKTYSLPSTYKTTNPYIANNGDWCIDCIDKETMNKFKEMQSDASSIGLNIYIASGYRSYNNQNRLYNNYVKVGGKALADTYSARPGHSEHQTGYCYDLNSVEDSFANTNEGKWIDQNAYLYGFIIRYPKGKEDITGYQYESWHLRYVGKELANKLYNNGNWITLEEYYGISSKY